MKKTLNKAIIVTLLICAAAFAYDPPEIIGELYGDPDSLHFGESFCCAGDQNGDGCDDLLVTAYKVVKLYFGGERIDNRPDMVFQGVNNDSIAEFYGDEGRIAYLGRLTDDNDKWIAMRVFKRLARRPYTFLETRVELFKGGEDLDTIPDFVFRRHPDYAYVIPDGEENQQPSDFNGDGYSDLLISFGGDTGEDYARLLMFFGGEDFDTIPDWTLTLNFPDYWAHGMSASTGGDVNGDGFDDFILGSPRGVELFAGGDPPDTVAVWTFQNDDEVDYCFGRWRILPDVNGDGYDDYGCYWDSLGIWEDYDRYYLFYGSDNPDAEPDLELEGNHSLGGTDGRLSGGDFNNDGFGDIVTTNVVAFQGEGEMHIHFGADNPSPQPDIVVNIYRNYDYGYGIKLGALGNYDGRPGFEFIAGRYPVYGGQPYGKLGIFGAGDDWLNTIDFKDEVMNQQWNLTVTASPNPFNNQIKLNYSISHPANATLTLFDIQGRRVKRFAKGFHEAGKYAASAAGFQSGIYFAVLQTNRGRVVRKVVCLK